MFKIPFRNAANTIPEYGPKTAHHSPFMKAGQVWDERMGKPIIEKRNWQMMCGVLSLSLLGVIGILGYREVYAPLPAYEVPVDGNGLIAGKSVPIAEARYTPTRAQVAADISKWIILTRSRPSDGYAMRANFLLAEAFMSGQGIKQHNEYKEKFDPWKHYKQAKDQTSKVTVTVSGPTPHADTSVQTFPVVSQLEGNSYHAEWKETRWEYGEPVKTFPITMTIRATATGQTDERKMAVNPGGTEIHWWEMRGE